MSAPVPRRPNLDAALRRRLARQSRDPNQTRRFLSPAKDGTRGDLSIRQAHEAADAPMRPGSRVADRARSGVRFNAEDFDARLNGKAPGAPQHCRLMRTGTRRTRNHPRFRHDFHGEGNYTISPKSKSLRLSFADGAYDADPAH